MPWPGAIWDWLFWIVSGSAACWIGYRFGYEEGWKDATGHNDKDTWESSDEG